MKVIVLFLVGFLCSCSSFKAQRTTASKSSSSILLSKLTDKIVKTCRVETRGMVYNINPKNVKFKHRTQKYGLKFLMSDTLSIVTNKDQEDAVLVRIVFTDTVFKKDSPIILEGLKSIVVSNMDDIKTAIVPFDGITVEGQNLSNFEFNNYDNKVVSALINDESGEVLNLTKFQCSESLF